MISKRFIPLWLVLAMWGMLLCLRSPSVAIADWAAWIPLRCPLRFLFDIDCPTCGLGRSLIAAGLGDWRASWSFHPFGLLLFWGLQALALLQALRPQAILHLWQHLSATHHQKPWLSVLLVAAYVVWGFFLRAPLPEMLLEH